MSLIIAVDTGGTFTDIAAFDLDAGTVAYAKALTTYSDLVDGVMSCVDEAGADLSHAMLEPAEGPAYPILKGAAAGLVHPSGATPNKSLPMLRRAIFPSTMQLKSMA